MEEDFYATIKLKTGEEIFARVSVHEENTKNILLVSNPITVSNYKDKNGRSAYKIEPWLKTTTEDMFIINLDNVITMCETNDIDMIMLHQSYLKKVSNFKETKTNLTRDMGYISNIKDAKKLLEKLYKNS